MAQNRKADEEQRHALQAEVVVTKDRMRKTAAAYADDSSLSNLRALQVATDAVAEANHRLREFDGDRSTSQVRHADANPRRSRASWPVGKPYEAPTGRQKIQKPDRPDTRPALPPPVMRPVELRDRVVVGKDGKERLGWWVGADRSVVAAGAAKVSSVPLSRTSGAPASKFEVKKVAQANGDARRDAISQKLQDGLHPSAGAFTVVPSAE